MDGPPSRQGSGNLAIEMKGVERADSSSIDPRYLSRAFANSEYSSACIDYARLKGHVRKAAAADKDVKSLLTSSFEFKEAKVNQATAHDLFWCTLKSEVDKVNTFFEGSCKDCLNRLDSLQLEKAGKPLPLQSQEEHLAVQLTFSKALKDMNPDELKSILTPDQAKRVEKQAHVNNELLQRFKAFLSLCGELDELRKFVVLNYLAVIKVLKRYDKNTQQDTKQLFLPQLEKLPLYTSHVLSGLLHRAETITESLVARRTVMEAEYLCPVCKNFLDRPVLIKCGHRCCFQCLTKNQDAFLCPVCKKQQDLTGFQIESVLQRFVGLAIKPEPGAPLSPSPNAMDTSSNHNNNSSSNSSNNNNSSHNNNKNNSSSSSSSSSGMNGHSLNPVVNPISSTHLHIAELAVNSVAMMTPNISGLGLNLALHHHHHGPGPAFQQSQQQTLPSISELGERQSSTGSNSGLAPPGHGGDRSPSPGRNRKRQRGDESANVATSTPGSTELRFQPTSAQQREEENRMTDQKSAATKPVNKVASAVAAEKRAGNQRVSCHQCKTNKAPDDMLFCTTPARGVRGRRCRKKYCDGCLRRAYSQSVATTTPDEQEAWQCPSCLGACTCAGCNKNKKANRKSRSKSNSPNPRPTSMSVSGKSKKPDDEDMAAAESEALPDGETKHNRQSSVILVTPPDSAASQPVNPGLSIKTENSDNKPLFTRRRSPGPRRGSRGSGDSGSRSPSASPSGGSRRTSPGRSSPSLNVPGRDDPNPGSPQRRRLSDPPSPNTKDGQQDSLFTQRLKSDKQAKEAAAASSNALPETYPLNARSHSAPGPLNRSDHERRGNEGGGKHHRKNSSALLTVPSSMDTSSHSNNAMMNGHLAAPGSSMNNNNNNNSSSHHQVPRPHTDPSADGMGVPFGSHSSGFGEAPNPPSPLLKLPVFHSDDPLTDSYQQPQPQQMHHQHQQMQAMNMQGMQNMQVGHGQMLMMGSPPSGPSNFQQYRGPGSGSMPMQMQMQMQGSAGGSSSHQQQPPMSQQQGPGMQIPPLEPAPVVGKLSSLNRGDSGKQLLGRMDSGSNLDVSLPLSNHNSSSDFLDSPTRRLNSDPHMSFLLDSNKRPLSMEDGMSHSILHGKPSLSRPGSGTVATSMNQPVSMMMNMNMNMNMNLNMNMGPSGPSSVVPSSSSSSKPPLSNRPPLSQIFAPPALFDQDLDASLRERLSDYDVSMTHDSDED